MSPDTTTMSIYNAIQNGKYLQSLLLIFILHWSGCKYSVKDKQKEEANCFEISNEIFLSEAFRGLKDELFLSEWVDSITYIPLETNPNNLMRKIQIDITPEYLFVYNNMCFDWDGKYLGEIGKVGQGPCEERETIRNVVNMDSFFYSLGSKLIKYHSNGICSGKWKEISLDPRKHKGRTRNCIELQHNGKNLITYLYPDSVLFFNTDFEQIGHYPIMEWNQKGWARTFGPDYAKHFTRYENELLFYNQYTDTIYSVLENTLRPKWVIKMDEEDKFTSECMYNYDAYFKENFRIQRTGVFRDSQFAKLIDNKIYVHSIHETNNHLFILGGKMIYAPKERGLPINKNFLIGIEKNTGKTIGSTHIIDDLGGMDTFCPRWGICNNIMVDAIWPYELIDFVKEKQKNNQTVDERLLKLAKEINSEDNPILILAHLKK